MNQDEIIKEQDEQLDEIASIVKNIKNNSRLIEETINDKKIIITVKNPKEKDGGVFGKGKEYGYYDSKNYLKFEGEYLNGKRNGKGIEYWIDGDLIFEGEYLDGKIWNGKGKGKYGFNSIFDGDYLNGKEWNGVVKKYSCRGCYFKTKIINGKRKKNEEQRQLDMVHTAKTHRIMVIIISLIVCIVLVFFNFSINSLLILIVFIFSIIS